MILLAIFLTLAACSSGAMQSGSAGPSIFNPRVRPNMITLSGSVNGSAGPPQAVVISAEVEDPDFQVIEVKARFIHAPVEIPMTRGKGNTWSVKLTPEQIRSLSVQGETLRYDADVVAENSAHQVTRSTFPVTILVSSSSVGEDLAGERPPAD